eukprot:gene14787-14963_t
MERVKANYSSGRLDQFRVKAAARAIRALETHSRPLVTAQDVNDMKLGTKTEEKLKEILTTGFLRRNIVMEGSERHKIMENFMSVWGVAEQTATKWYQSGCRSLADVAQKFPHLTAQQRVGLHYHQDFACRIPRAEVRECVALVRQAVVEVLQ